MQQNPYNQPPIPPVGEPHGQSPVPPSNNKVAAGICGILLGVFGVHKFILGYNTEGIIMLLVSILGGLVTCGAASVVVSIIGLVEGIIYLIKTDEEFMNTYVYNRKPWF